MLINYRNLAGVEISYLDGIIYFWVESGIYTVEARTVKKYKCHDKPRQVVVHLVDTESDNHKVVTKPFNTELGDSELIHRFLDGSASCDCVRGKLMYGPTLHFECNKGVNRFELRKMVIRGETSNCTLEYKGYK